MGTSNAYCYPKSVNLTVANNASVEPKLFDLHGGHFRKINPRTPITPFANAFELPPHCANFRRGMVGDFGAPPSEDLDKIGETVGINAANDNVRLP